MYIYIYKISWPTKVQGDLKALFPVATTWRCREENCFPLTQDPYLILLSVKQEGIKFHYLSLWYDLIWEWTPASQAIGEHSNHYTYGPIYIRGSLNKFPDFFHMGTFIDSTHMKLWSPSKYSPLAAMHLYYSNNFSKAPWKSSCVSMSMTFVTTSFISSIVS